MLTLSGVAQLNRTLVYTAKNHESKLFSLAQPPGFGSLLASLIERKEIGASRLEQNRVQ